MSPRPDRAASRSWASAAPVVSVVVSTFGREALLTELVRSLEAQTLAPGDLEVVIVDNGSADETWVRLQELAGSTTLPLLAVRLDHNRGAAGGRNAGIGEARADIVAFTDDDCLPQPAWLPQLLVPFAEGADIVQGRTEPDDRSGGWPQPWARTVWIREPSWLFETCNIAYRRSVLDAAGGFGEDDRLTGRHAGRAFGEDVLLASRALGSGASFAFCDGAVVHHRWMPGTFRTELGELRQLRHFPALARRAPEITRSFWRGPFLSRRTAATDLAVAGVVAAVAGRRTARVLGGLAVLPWLVDAWPRARVRRGRRVAVRLAQLAVADAVAVASLAEGSVRSRRLLL